MRQSGLELGAVLVTCLASQAFAFWRMPCLSRLIDERADPLLSPGAISPHVHSIAGGNGFALLEDYAQARTATCSSCPIKQDLSNYWTPKLYMHFKDNDTFVEVPQAGDTDGALGGMNVYYE